jgi:hypothetical protein
MYEKFCESLDFNQESLVFVSVGGCVPNGVLSYYKSQVREELMSCGNILANNISMEELNWYLPEG